MFRPRPISQSLPVICLATLSTTRSILNRGNAHCCAPPAQTRAGALTHTAPPLFCTHRSASSPWCRTWGMEVFRFCGIVRPAEAAKACLFRAVPEDCVSLGRLETVILMIDGWARSRASGWMSWIPSSFRLAPAQWVAAGGPARRINRNQTNHRYLPIDKFKPASVTEIPPRESCRRPKSQTENPGGPDI